MSKLMKQWRAEMTFVSQCLGRLDRTAWVEDEGKDVETAIRYSQRYFDKIKPWEFALPEIPHKKVVAAIKELHKTWVVEELVEVVWPNPQAIVRLIIDGDAPKEFLPALFRELYHKDGMVETFKEERGNFLVELTIYINDIEKTAYHLIENEYEHEAGEAAIGFEAHGDLDWNDESGVAEDEDADCSYEVYKVTRLDDNEFEVLKKLKL